MLDETPPFVRRRKKLEANVSRRWRVAGLVTVASVLVAVVFLSTKLKGIAGEPVDGDLWLATVKKGTMFWEVRGRGTLVRIGRPAKVVARVTVPDPMASNIRRNQEAEVDTGKILVKGRVRHVGLSPTANGMLTVDIALDSALPEGMDANLR